VLAAVQAQARLLPGQLSGEGVEQDAGAIAKDALPVLQACVVVQFNSGCVHGKGRQQVPVGYRRL